MFAPGLHGTRQSSFDHVGRGYSDFVNVISLCVGGIIAAFILIHSAVRHFKGVPKVLLLFLFNSGIIILLCRRPKGDKHAHRFPVSLGIANEPGQDYLSDRVYGRLALSTDINIKKPPMEGEMYIGPVIKEKDR